MGVWEPLLPIGLSNLEFTLKSNITICETLSPGIYAPSSPGFLDDEFPSDDDILEDMIMDFLPPIELETLKVGYQASNLASLFYDWEERGCSIHRFRNFIQICLITPTLFNVNRIIV
jgi:hypothetical protein